MAFLAKYHGNGSRDNPIVQLEWKEFKENIKLDDADKRWWDYVRCFCWGKRLVTDVSPLVKTH
jgi:hypothetical protein